MIAVSKKFIKTIIYSFFLIIITLLLVLAISLIIIDYKPKELEQAKHKIYDSSLKQDVFFNKEISILSWNIGYAGLGKDENFFFDGGKEVRPKSKEIIEKYLQGICKTLNDIPSDIYLLQEVDEDSKRSYHMDQKQVLLEQLKMDYYFAYNYCCLYVPFPLPPIGKVMAGVTTFTNFNTLQSTRYSLPVSFKWPISIANLKRCLLINRIPINGSDKELIIINLHLEAFDSGEGKVAQTNTLKKIMFEEYEKGNFVVAGGDFNQVFSTVDDSKYPKIWDGWSSGFIDANDFPKGWQLVTDDTYPTCRDVSRSYNDEDAKNHNWQYYVIDGFILSPNVKLLQINVINEDFVNSDHNPVYMKFILEK